jgi:hypothetical protein
MQRTTESKLLALALAITKKNLEKGKTYTKTKYVGDVKPKPKVKSKNHVIKSGDDVYFHVRGNMSGTAFKNMIEKNEDTINDFMESDKELLKL